MNAARSDLVVRPAPIRSHRFADAMCRTFAEMVVEDASLLERARSVLDRRPSGTYADAWRRLLDAGEVAVVAVLTSDHPSTRGLKSDNPFAELGLVDDDARDHLLEVAYAS